MPLADGKRPFVSLYILARQPSSDLCLAAQSNAAGALHFSCMLGMHWVSLAARLAMLH